MGCSSRLKTDGENQTYGGAPNPPFIVGTGVLDCPFRYESKFFPRRTVRQLVARTPCPYRGLNDFRSFVRRRKMMRTRLRTPHPSACGCHLPPLGKAVGTCEQRMKPKDRADNLAGGCKHTPLRSVASLLRKHCPSPTEMERDLFICAKPKDSADNLAAGASPRPTKIEREPFVCAKPNDSADNVTGDS